MPIKIVMEFSDLVCSLGYPQDFDQNLTITSSASSNDTPIQGEEATLQQALSIVQKNKNDYVALLFYASWCPFSRACKPNFNALSLLFPSIRHFAFEESVIRPSILSRYGVHGFPTLFLINSTMRVRYHGSRAVASLIAFYNDVTGIPLRPLDLASLERLLRAPINGRPKDVELENCPFSWARSPERFFQEDTYLALAAAFVVCRVVYLLLPSVLGCGRRAWRRHGGVARFASLWDGSRMAFAKLSLNPCRRRDLQEGAMNAKIWASKSLVPVTMGEPSSVRRAHSGFQRT
ncbi:unnamed protein product [Spirodela intermedia]|uniref:Thioredoxin domain-containing protein n=1 Tax=Spirodela intermedia TaxID=51605 RepID=A0A7I8KD22_SPIIN|nr:unnamed protein product [Spirodela intermedia]